jgi:geranylgeranyl diphosphate synthase type II
MNLSNLLDDRRTLIDSALNYYLPGEEEYPRNIHRAMRYSVFAGGKRIRPLLTLLTAELFTPDWKRALPAACALELIHTYSLIHDDLPAMDDDDYRRGRLTSHKVFGEGMAILAGDALLTLAFELLTDKSNKFSEFDSSYWQYVDPGTKLNVIFEIAVSAGVKGMVGGQVVDLESEGKCIDVETLEYIDSHKTGELVMASIRIGALLAQAGEKDLHRLTLYGRLLGRAFQIVDDLLDVEGNEEKMGKARGMDAKKEKATFISLRGIAEAKVRRDQLYSQALKELDYFGNKAAPLQEMTRFILYRDY